MPGILDYKPDSRYVILFVGESGTAKTPSATTFPQPFHELDFDNRIGGVYQSLMNGYIKGDKITYTSFDITAGWNPVGKELERINIAKLGYKQNPSMSPFPYQTLGCGSLSSLRRLIVNLALEKMPGHMKIGEPGDKFPLVLGAPGDVKAEGNGIFQVLDYLFSMPCNIIVTAHITQKYGKPKEWYREDGKPKDEYTFRPSEVIGEQITLSPNVAAEVVSKFNNVFKFQTRLVGGKVKYEVIFSDGDIAKNEFGIPPGTYEFTGRPFFEFFKEKIEEVRAKKAKG